MSKSAMQELIEDITIEKRLGYITENAANKILDYINNLYLEKEKEQSNQLIRDVFEHCWNHSNWNGEYDIKDMNEYLKTYKQNK